MPENAFVASLNLARPVESFSNGFQIGLSSSDFLLRDRAQQEQMALENARLAEQKRQGAANTAFDQKKMELAERELALNESAMMFDMKMSQARAARGGGGGGGSRSGSRSGGSSSSGGQLYSNYQAAAAAHGGAPFSGHYTDDGYVVTKVWNYGGGGGDDSNSPTGTGGAGDPFGLSAPAPPSPSATAFSFEGSSFDADQGSVLSPTGNAFGLPEGGGQPTPYPQSVGIDSLGEGGQQFVMPERPDTQPAQATPSGFSRQTMLNMDDDQLYSAKQDLGSKVAFLEEQQSLASSAKNYPAASQFSAQKVAFKSQLDAVSDELDLRAERTTEASAERGEPVYTDSVMDPDSLDGKAKAEVEYSLPDLVEIYKMAAQEGEESTSRATAIRADVEQNHPLLHRKVVTEMSMERAKIDSGSRVPRPAGNVGTEALRDPGTPVVSGERAKTLSFIQGVSKDAQPASASQAPVKPSQRLLGESELNFSFDPPSRGGQAKY